MTLQYYAMEMWFKWMKLNQTKPSIIRVWIDFNYTNDKFIKHGDYYVKNEKNYASHGDKAATFIFFMIKRCTYKSKEGKILMPCKCKLYGTCVVM